MVIFKGEKPERCDECELSNAGRCKFNPEEYHDNGDGTWTVIDIDYYPGCKHCVFGDEIPVLKPIVVFKDGTIVGYQDTAPVYSKQPIMQGWVCPVCGRGLSPFVNACPCISGKRLEITC